MSIFIAASAYIQRAMNEADVPRAEPAAAPLRILLVEDDEFDVAVFGRAFRRAGIACEIVRCRTGEEALEGLRDAELELDLLVTDHQLPGLSGFDLCLKLIDGFRSRPEPSEPPFALVLLTGVGSEQMAIRALRAGINDYIVKDTSREYLDLLPLVLPRVARRHRLRRQRKLAAAARDGYRVGLSTCAQVVEQRGGRVWVENGAGQGPALLFRVPLAPDEVAYWVAAGETSGQDPAAPSTAGGAGAGAEPSAADAGGAGEPSATALPAADASSRRVLIVNPNPVVAFVARRSLERCGYRCATVESGPKAIEALEREPFDLVLMALRMPELDGLETARRIRHGEGRSDGHLPILMLGAGADQRRRQEAGIDGTIQTPISARSLKAAIERLE